MTFQEYLPPEKLEAVAGEFKGHYSQAKPFPHAVIDNLFSTEVLQKIVKEFPKPGEVDWIQFNDSDQIKLALDKESQFGHHTKLFLYHLNSASFISFLENLTGISGLISDPLYEGGGLHQIQPSGKLAVHADFNKHKFYGLDRRLNVLIYLNSNWQDSYGGHLELWDEGMKSCQQKILPVFNRMVVFSTTSTSYHGHPNPLTCPPERTRKSLALYYYSNGRPQDEITGAHNTLFQRRPGEKVHRGFKHYLRKLIPPVVFDIKNKLFT